MTSKEGKEKDKRIEDVRPFVQSAIEKPAERIVRAYYDLTHRPEKFSRTMLTALTIKIWGQRSEVDDDEKEIKTTAIIGHKKGMSLCKSC